MFKLRIYCSDPDGEAYWEEGVEEYASYDEALIACYENALQETRSLMETSDCHNWFEVETDFEITEAYTNELLKSVVFFPVAVVYYDKAPWVRENDCAIEIVTGYDIVKTGKE